MTKNGDNGAGMTTISVQDLPAEYQAVARIIGMEKALELSKSAGGSSIYVPKINSLMRGIKHRAVRREFTGANYRQLAQKYGYTEKWIRDIVNSKEGV
jgi:Mor family transcriptional regulator